MGADASTQMMNNIIKDSRTNLMESSENVIQNINNIKQIHWVDLREIAWRAKNAEYNPKRFADVIMRIREPKTTALMFASCKMVCTSAR